MAKKTTKSVKKAPMAPAPMRSGLEKHHVTFSHIMYALFLVSIAFAALSTFSVIGMFGSAESGPAALTAIMMLLWSFLFWEFGHRIHTA
jgi:hypothetical protein